MAIVRKDKRMPKPRKPVDLLNAQSTNVSVHDAELDRYDDSDEIERLFDEAFIKRPNSEFLEDLYSWWEDKQFLTAKQYAALNSVIDGDES